MTFDPSRSEQVINWGDAPLALIVKEAVNDIDGNLPLAWMYRRMIHSKRLCRYWRGEVRDNYRRRQYEFIAGMIRVMGHNRSTQREIVKNIFFFTSFLSELRLFKMVKITIPMPAFYGEGIDRSFEYTPSVIRVPDIIVNLKIYDPKVLARVEFHNGLVIGLETRDYLYLKKESPIRFEYDRANTLSGLVQILEEGGFEVTARVQEILALTAMLRSKTVVTPFEGGGLDHPPALSPQEADHIKKIMGRFIRYT